MKAIETHHISYEPEITVDIPLELHHEIHGTVSNKSKLSILMRQYDKLTKLTVMVKNWSKAFKKEFGEQNLSFGLQSIDSKREKILSLIKDEFGELEFEIINSINGMGVRFFAGIIAYANPIEFSSLRKFLSYCGYRGYCKFTNRYNRNVKTIVYQLVTDLIMHKNERYYPLYKKIKTDLQNKYPSYSKGKIDGMARNRVGTFLLKEIYIRMRG